MRTVSHPYTSPANPLVLGDPDPEVVPFRVRLVEPIGGPVLPGDVLWVAGSAAYDLVDDGSIVEVEEEEVEVEGPGPTPAEEAPFDANRAEAAAAGPGVPDTPEATPEVPHVEAPHVETPHVETPETPEAPEAPHVDVDPVIAELLEHSVPAILQHAEQYPDLVPAIVAAEQAKGEDARSSLLKGLHKLGGL